MSKGEQTCLVLKNDGIGDLIASSGIIASLTTHFPGGLDLVTCEQNRELASMIPGIRNVFCVSRDGLRLAPLLDRAGLFIPVVRGSPRACVQDFGALVRLRSRTYDVAVSLRRFIRASTVALMRQCRARQRLAAFEFCTNLPPARADRACAAWTRYRGPATLLSEQAYYAEFLRETLAVDVDVTPRLQLPPARASSDPLRVGICLSGASMRWDSAGWEVLVGELLAAGWQVVLLGGDDSRGEGERLRRLHPRCESLIGQLGFRSSVAPLSTLAAYIGNDTGFSHFASLIVPRCLILTGGGTHGRFFPWQGATNQYVVYFGLDCFDCDWRCKFPRRLCVDRLTVRDVLRCFQHMTAPTWTGPTWENLNPLTAHYQIAWRHQARPALGSLESRPRSP